MIIKRISVLFLILGFLAQGGIMPPKQDSRLLHPNAPFSLREDAGGTIGKIILRENTVSLWYQRPLSLHSHPACHSQNGEESQFRASVPSRGLTDPPCPGRLPSPDEWGILPIHQPLSDG